jgi:enoyl-CoA hydratase
VRRLNYDSVKLATFGHTAVITISRPSALNALNSTVLDELDGALAEVRADKDCRALIITGDGEKAFVAGADIGEMRDLGPDEAVAFARRGQAVFRAIEELPIPVIAAVNGYALGGGCELALACDIRIASENARFAQPETGLGIIPGFGGSVRLPATVGRARAAYLILTGKQVNAADALTMGLVSEVTPRESLMERANEIAAELAARSPVALAHAKRVMITCSKAYEREALEFGKCFETGDPREGMSAFLERRKPGFAR